MYISGGENVYPAEVENVLYERPEVGKLFFSAKEAFYKCQYEATRTLIDFQDVELDVELGTGTFSISGIAHRGGHWDLVKRANGKFRRQSGFMFTAAVLTAPNNHPAKQTPAPSPLVRTKSTTSLMVPGRSAGWEEDGF